MSGSISGSQMDGVVATKIKERVRRRSFGRLAPAQNQPLQSNSIDILASSSSLGDDSRFENVRRLRNGRLDAAKESCASLLLYRNHFSSGSSSNNVRRLGSTSSMRSLYMRSLGDRTDKPPKQQKQRRKPKSESELDYKDRTPYLTKALRSLSGDIVILGGYRGSILRSTKSGQRLWPTMKMSLNIQKVNLELKLDSVDETEDDQIKADDMLKNVGIVDISKVLLQRLKESENFKKGVLQVHAWGYDWRLSPHVLSSKLRDFLRQLDCNSSDVPREDRGATVIAHSLGGLITRHAVNQEPCLFKGVIYAGTPQNCITILGPLRNGDKVLFNKQVLNAQTNFSMRTSYAFLPLDGKCFKNKNTGKEYPLDFFNVNTWIDYALSPVISPPLPASGRPKFRSTTDEWWVKFKDPSASEIAAEGLVAPHLSRRTKSRRTTIQKEKAIAYLERTLSETCLFKQQLASRSELRLSNVYPPIAVLFGKEQATVCGARVDGLDAIKRLDAFNDLQFASGDGVVLAKEAQAPMGYRVQTIVSTPRGHLTLLGDLNGVGKCLIALEKARRSGVGLGV